MAPGRLPTYHGSVIRSHHLRPRLRLIAVALVATGCAAATTLGAPVVAQLTPGAAAELQGGLRPAARRFIVEGVETSRSLAELSRVAESTAHSTAVRSLAQQMVTDFGEMDRSLEALARDKAVAVPLQPTSFSHEARQLAGKSGSAFDRAFIPEITAAAQRQLRLCEAALASAKDPDVRQLAGSLLPMLRDHVNRALALEKSL